MKKNDNSLHLHKTISSKQAAERTWQDRVKVEKAELDDKIARLQEALRASVLKNSAANSAGEVPAAGFDDHTTLELFEQLTHMQEYSRALQRRIDRF